MRKEKEENLKRLNLWLSKQREENERELKEPKK